MAAFWLSIFNAFESIKSFNWRNPVVFLLWRTEDLVELEAGARDMLVIAMYGAGKSVLKSQATEDRVERDSWSVPHLSERPSGIGC